jgi:elongation factor Ts
MAVTLENIKILREMTLAGMASCKSALEEAAGDIEKAVLILREKGLASAVKKAGRATAEGIVFGQATQGVGSIFELNCETDFVTKNEAFIAFAEDIKTMIGKHNPSSLEALLNTAYKNGTVDEYTKTLVATIGENIQLRNFATIGNGVGVVGCYNHGSKISVLVELQDVDSARLIEQRDAIQKIAFEVALQVASMKPSYLRPSMVPESVIETEREVLKNKYKDQKKPDHIMAKIIESGVQSWCKESCLEEQSYVKNEDITIKNFVLAEGKKLGLSGLNISSFIMMELGAGVEKKVEDFAAEVAAQISSVAK